ncbi:MAG TPA: thioredoxin domain-containing protein [Candidatus Acidoferrum sp.]|nr:thioredoxin domain-containing protein [Candidatus Acidoferrum sp.]
MALLLLLAACHKENTKPISHMTATTTTNAKAHQHTNRLAREKSPYLLQHAHNPVDWFAWSDEAFEKAKRENKPIFLSIGYSTCHWCHVMERESFENEEVANFLRKHFVSIKVDREERPDVDKIYMTFVQAMTSSGGWPLNVFLTPDRKPFFGGTYWPPEAKYGRPSFLQVLQQVAGAWQSKSKDILNSAQSLSTQLAEMTERSPSNRVTLNQGTLQNAGLRLKEGYDEKNGGWGNAPKFPSPSHPRFLLRYAARFGDDEAKRMVLHTCDKMAAGGIYDQIGGGFSRYSVDARWLVPHFEKMLYDNAQLAQLYLDAYLISGETRHADVVRDVLRYVLRDMTHPDGGFYSAEDADSEGKEGKFYCWTVAELKQLLTADEFAVATNYFGVADEGNFLDHSDPNPLPNQNVLSIANAAAAKDKDDLIESAKAKLSKERAKRIRPGLDDKILASWNGLMLGAVSRAGIVLGDETFQSVAEKNLKFIQAKLWDAKTETLYHRWRDGQRDTTQLLESYAFLLSGVIELYEATLKPEHLDFAIALAESLVERFYDKEHGGFWQSTADSKDLILRVKDDYDGAEPSGNSVAAMSLLRLAAITERKDFRDAADKTIQLFADRLQQLPQAVPFMLAAFDFASEEPRRAVIVGDVSSTGGKSLLCAAHAIYQPNKVVLSSEGAVEPFAKTLKPKDGKATAYVCTGTACQAPTHDADTLKKSLR